MGWRSINRTLDTLVDATKASRDRYIDFLRAFAIVVVVLWHWVLSTVHWGASELVMTNPIGHIPLGWVPTWLLQVMPLFFFVGGFANLAAWKSAHRSGGGARTYYRRRVRRLVTPVAAFAAVWVAVEAVLHVALPSYRGVHDYGLVTFMPLWFIAAYLGVVVVVPITAAVHERCPVVGVLTLGAVVVLVDAGRFGLAVEALGYVNSALVWVFVHQLGYFYRDGRLVAAQPWAQWGLAVGGVAALVVITALPPYPVSIVAVEDVETSHMYPTTVGIAAVAVLQAGVILRLRPTLSRWLHRRRPWKAIVALNAVIMTVFVWHTTALLAAIGLFEALDGRLLAEPTAGWWLQRPLWLLLPAATLAPIVAVFSRFEVGKTWPLRT